MKLRGERPPCGGAGDVTVPSSSGWRSDLEHAAVELGQLVEEQHAVVGQADLAGRGIEPPPTSPRR